MVIVKRVGVLSLGKTLACLYAALGLIVGALVSLAAMAGAFAARGGEGAASVLFGVGAVVLLPVFYGVIGFVGGVIVAAIYNVVASIAGGVELELEQPPVSRPPMAY